MQIYIYLKEFFKITQEIMYCTRASVETFSGGWPMEKPRPRNSTN